MRHIAQWMGLLTVGCALLLPGRADAQCYDVGNPSCFPVTSVRLARGSSYDLDVKARIGKDKTIDLNVGGDVVFYKNLFVCKNKGGKESFSPGIGHISLTGQAQGFVDDVCIVQGNCGGTVEFPSEIGTHCYSEDVRVPCSSEAKDLFAELFASVKCRNANDTLVRLYTQGICAIASATDGDYVVVPPPAECSVAEDGSLDVEKCKGLKGWRFTTAIPFLEQKPGDLFDKIADPECIRCVLSGGKWGCIP